MDLRVAAYAVIERRGKILLTHWRRGHLHGWTLPGGGLEAGEDPRDAVEREVLEETGLTARVGRLLGVDSRVMVREEVPEGKNPELHTIRIVYRATVQDGPLQNEVGGSSDEARWVPLKELNSLKTLSLVQTALRMAGISTRGQARGGSAKAGQARTGGAKGSARGAGAKRADNRGAAGKPGAGKSTAGKPGSAKQTAGKQGSHKQGAAKAAAAKPNGGKSSQAQQSAGVTAGTQRNRPRKRAQSPAGAPGAGTTKPDTVGHN